MTISKAVNGRKIITESDTEGMWEVDEIAARYWSSSSPCVLLVRMMMMLGRLPGRRILFFSSSSSSRVAAMAAARTERYDQYYVSLSLFLYFSRHAYPLFLFSIRSRFPRLLAESFSLVKSKLP